MAGCVGNYFTATRHPLAGLIFVLPLLVCYEAGVYVFGAAPTEEIRNGADAWLRGILQQGGISAIYGAPILLVAGLVLWCLLRRGDRPGDLLGLWIGMMIESAAFALGLACLSQAIFPVMQALGGLLNGPGARLVGLSISAASTELAWEQIIGFIGAGIYEETVFRLIAYSGLVALLAVVECPRGLNLTLATVAASLLFAAAHNLGAHGEPFRLVVFMFRTCAGIYFTWIYHTRGFGIAVGAHAGYDVLVGILMRLV